MKLLSRPVRVQTQTSYAQCGEDIIAKYLLNRLLKIQKPSYLDIGAHHPTYLSNTYLFYKEGSCGVCVEPAPDLCGLFESQRKRDTCLNCGVGNASRDEAEFYVMHPRTLSTFSREEALENSRIDSFRIERIIQVPLITINSMIEDHFDACPHFVSLDMEGNCLEVLEALDFDRYRPQVFCIETLEYRSDRSAEKLPQVNRFMDSKEYLVYADTYINTIFVDRRAWEGRS